MKYHGEFNIKAFLQSGAYESAKENLSEQLNFNSVYFNSDLRPIKVGSNLVAIDRNVFKKTKSERDVYNALRSEYYKNPLAGRDEVLAALVNSHVPNWGSIKFKEIKIRNKH